jgi:hypothetical protein
MQYLEEKFERKSESKDSCMGSWEKKGKDT